MVVNGVIDAKRLIVIFGCMSIFSSLVCGYVAVLGVPVLPGPYNCSEKSHVLLTTLIVILVQE